MHLLSERADWRCHGSLRSCSGLAWPCLRCEWEDRRSEGGSRAEETERRSSGQGRQPPALEHRNKDQLSLCAQESFTGAVRYGSWRQTPHRAGFWVLGPGRRWTGRETGVKTEEGEKTTTLETDGVALNSDNKATLRDKWSAWYRGWRPERKTVNSTFEFYLDKFWRREAFLSKL